MDGRSNVHKPYKNQRREHIAKKALTKNNLRGQIRNTPDYTAKAIAVCKFFEVEVVASSFEADPQVFHYALEHSLIPKIGDSYLLAYIPSNAGVDGG